jgi:hypothetical protein
VLADVVLGPGIEGEVHRIAVAEAEDLLHVRVEFDRCAGVGERLQNGLF